MNTDHSIPPLRDLSSDRLAARKQHLLAEIVQKGEPRSSLPTLRLPRLRLAVVAGAGACLAAGAVALVLTLTGGSATERAPFVVQAVRGPAWSAHTANWGGGDMNMTPNAGMACTSAAQVLFGCNGTLTLPGLEVPGGAAVTPSTTPSSAASPETAIDGGTGAEGALLRRIIAQVQPNSIERINVISNGNQVTLHMTAPSTAMRTLWEESLVAAAFRDRSKAAKKQLTVLLVNGDSLGIIPPGPATPLPPAMPKDAQIVRQRFENAAAKIGVPLDELTIGQPDGIAVAATLSSSDPASFLLHQMPTFLAALGDRWRDYDGTYIRLVDDSGTTVWETSSTGRISSGAVGSREDLAGCSPVANHGPTPPPCPAN